MYSFILLAGMSLIGLFYIWPCIRAYQSAIGVHKAIAQSGDSLIKRIRLRLVGLKTIILGYIALFISSLPDLVHGFTQSMPEIKAYIEQIDFSYWFSQHTVIAINNVLNIAMIFGRIAGMLALVNGISGIKSVNKEQDIQ